MPDLTALLLTLLTALPFIAHWVIVIGLSVRVIMQRHPTGTTLAWLTLLAFLPLVGAGLYLLVGELWLPGTRIRRTRAIHAPYHERIAAMRRRAGADWEQLGEIAQGLDAQSVQSIGFPALSGNTVELFDEGEPCWRALIADIDASERSCNLLFYIWSPGDGWPAKVGESLKRAAARGVTCRVLVDAVGSKPFLASEQPAAMRSAGVQVVAAMPVGMLRALFARVDIRNHRKIAVIDGRTAYTGSLNMIDPAHFKQSACVGQWVDVMARVQGPAAEALNLTLLADWSIEAGQRVRMLGNDSDLPAAEPAGETCVQVVPSGPGRSPQVIHDMVLTMIYGARRKLIITTPYFIPSESMMTALTSAARRGVGVVLVVPKKVDSVLVARASRSYYEQLLEAGVEVRLYRGGLLHAKTITVDDEVSLIGTVNMDKRSFWINYEVSSFVSDAVFTGTLHELQWRYIRDADMLDLDEWRRRPAYTRFVENVMQLVGPLL